MKLAAFLLRLGILAAALIVFAYGPWPDGFKAICCAVVLCGYLSTTDY